MLVIFLFLWQIPERNNLKEQGLILAHNLRGFSHGQLTPLFEGSWQGRNTTGEGHGRANLFTHGSQEAKKCNRKRPGPSYTL
jgi:hypothetical protein